jgi:hypothetical protein
MVLPPDEWIACWTSAVNVPTIFQGKIVRRALVAIHVPVHCSFACTFHLQKKERKSAIDGSCESYFVDISLMYII